MRDPFRSNTQAQLIREAQIGLSFVALLFALFVYVAYYRLTGSGRSIPQHVRNAPVAESVWPNGRSQSVSLVEDSVQPPINPELPAVAEPRSISYGHVTSETFESLPHRTAAQEPWSSRPSSRPLSDPQKFPSSPTLPTRSPNSLSLTKHPSLRDTFSNSSPTDVPTFQPATDVSIEKPQAADPKLSLVETRPAAELTSVETVAIPTVAPESEPFEPLVQQSSYDETVSTQKIPPAEFSSSGNDFQPRENSRPASVSASVAEKNANSINQPVLKAPLPIASINVAQTSEFNELNSLRPAKPHDRAFDPPATIHNADESSNRTEPENFSATSSQLAEQHSDEVALTQATLPPASNDFDVVDGGPESPADATLPDIATSQTSLENHATKRNSTASNNPDHSKANALSNTTATQQSDELLQSDPYSHIVQPGDSFWTIAQQRYDNGDYFRALYKYNEHKVSDFNLLIPGTQIDTPTKAQLQRQWPELCPMDDGKTTVRLIRSANSIYVTSPGDTLFEIARQRLGQASRYLEILQRNAARLPAEVNHLTPLLGGLELDLPTLE